MIREKYVVDIILSVMYNYFTKFDTNTEWYMSIPDIIFFLSICLKYFIVKNLNEKKSTRFGNLLRVVLKEVGLTGLKREWEGWGRVDSPSEKFDFTLWVTLEKVFNHNFLSEL